MLFATHIYFNMLITMLLFSCSVLFDSLRPYGRRLPCPSHLPELAQTLSIESVMPSDHLILCHLLLLLPSISPSIKVFSTESILHIRWPKYWFFSFSINPANEYSGLISFRTDWFDLLAVQGTLKSLLQQSHFKSINYSKLSFFYGPTLTSIHDYWNMFLLLPFPCDSFL